MINRWTFFIMTLTVGSICASEIDLKEIDSYFHNYIELLTTYPHLKQTGKQCLGEIEIVTDPIMTLKICHDEYQRLIQRGVNSELAKKWSLPGVVYSDPYLLWIRDPVLFPNEKTGLFKRIVWRCTLNQEKPVAILPIAKNGKIHLIKIWRHATGSWEFELPRGAPEPGEKSLETASRELREEVGFSAEKIISVGNVNPDSGVLTATIEVFIAFESNQMSTQWDEIEMIDGIYSFSIEEIEMGIKNGFIELWEDGKSSKIYLRDPFLTFALYQAFIRRLPPFD